MGTARGLALALPFFQQPHFQNPIVNYVEQRARELNAAGIEALDALRLASAEAARADLFCTGDDRLLKKARNILGLQTRVVSPLEAIEEIEP